MQNFWKFTKFLDFALGRNGNGIFIRVNGKFWKKMKQKLKELSSRRRVQSVIPALKEIKIPNRTGSADGTSVYGANSRRGYWWTSNTIAVKVALTKERLIGKGYYDVSNAYQSMHVNY